MEAKGERDTRADRHEEERQTATERDYERHREAQTDGEKETENDSNIHLNYNLFTLSARRFIVLPEFIFPRHASVVILKGAT